MNKSLAYVNTSLSNADYKSWNLERFAVVTEIVLNATKFHKTLSLLQFHFENIEEKRFKYRSLCYGLVWIKETSLLHKHVVLSKEDFLEKVKGFWLVRIFVK